MKNPHLTIFIVLLFASPLLGGCIGDSSNSGESSAEVNETAESENELLKQQLVDLENEVFELEQRLNNSTSENSVKPEIYRENLTEIVKPREMSIYYGYPNRVNNAPQFDVSEVQRKTTVGDVEFDMRTGAWELIQGDGNLENYSVSETLYWYDFPQKLATGLSGSAMIENASEILAMYDIAFLHRNVANTAESRHLDAVEIINKAREKNPDIQIIGLVRCTEELDDNLNRISVWSNVIAASSIKLEKFDEVPFDQQEALMSHVRNNSLTAVFETGEWPVGGLENYTLSSGDGFHRTYVEFDADLTITRSNARHLLDTILDELNHTEVLGINYYVTHDACNSGSELIPEKSLIRTRDTLEILGVSSVSLHGSGCDTHDVLISNLSSGLTSPYSSNLRYEVSIPSMVEAFTWFDDVVFSGVVFEPGHESQPYMKILVPELRKINPEQKLYGYVTLDNEDMSGQEVDSMLDLFDEWGLDGVFFDEAGYKWNWTNPNSKIEIHETDIQERRDYQNARIDAAHSNNLTVIINNYRPNETLGTHGVENRSNLRSGDIYLMESCIVRLGEWTDAIEDSGIGGYHGKTLLARNLTDEFEGAIICGVDDLREVEFQEAAAMYDYTLHYSVMMDVEYYFYHLGPTYDNLATNFSTSILDGLGSFWTSEVMFDGRYFVRHTDTGTLILDSFLHTVLFEHFE